MNPNLQWLLKHIPDALIYGAMLVILVCAVVKCFLPVMRGTAALRHACQLLADGSRMKLTRPVWSDAGFLGKGLSREWRDYLLNAETLDAHGQPCGVEDYINEDTIINIPGNAPLADLTPGLFTSLGILGTFIGLTQGLGNINMNEMERTITQMIAGLALAFQTSIVGLVCSLSFNILLKAIVGRARNALAAFTDKFYRFGAPRPIDTANQLVTLQQEQLASMRAFSEEIGASLSGEIEKAVFRSLQPVAQSMDRFLEGTTRQQIEGVRHVVNQFVMAMDQALEGRVAGLREALEQTIRQQQALRDDLRATAQITSAQTNDSEAMQRVTRQVLARFDEYVNALSERNMSLEEQNNGAGELLSRLHNAASEQADYLVQLREHQEALEKYLLDYNLWMRGFAETLGSHTQSQREALSAIAHDLKEGADMLQGSYGSFVENIQEGLAGALGLFDESIQKQTGRITLALDAMMRSPAARNALGQLDDAQAREDMRGDMRELTKAIETLNAQLSRLPQERGAV
ncbi:MAG: MotA/TolQ/ExbB proton channel family protein [Oscillospiraceae bacterium]|jgi:hypothetical protein|nr:MotA/TolQ/ExbB proton channel family protein [Oscillospiraceae bacterium]